MKKLLKLFILVAILMGVVIGEADAKILEEAEKVTQQAGQARIASEKAKAEKAKAEGEEPVKKNRFDDLIIVLSPDGKSLMSTGGKLLPNEAEKAQNDALIMVLRALNRGEIPAHIPKSLSAEQAAVIYKLRQYHEGLDNSGRAQLKSDLKRKDCKSLYQIQLYLRKNNKK